MSTPISRRILHLGPFQPTLEAALADEIARVRAADPMMPVVVLCPTPLLGQHLKRTLVDRLAGRAGFARGHGGIRFATLPELAATLGTRALTEAGRAALPEGAERVLWRRAAAALPAGGFFDPIRATRGFAGAARATIRDLKAAGLTPSVAERRARGDTRLDRKLRELARLWRSVEDATGAAGFFDDLDLMREAAEAAHGDPPMLRRAAAFLYGFHALSRTERRLVTGFLQRPVTAALVPWADEEGGESFRAVEPLRDFLQGTLELLPEDSCAVPPKPPLPFLVIAAPGDAREATEIARVIPGTPGPLNRTGILMRTPESQAARLDSALGDAGIPHYLPGELPVGHQPAARALRLLLECRRDDMPRRAVLELATTTPLRFEALLGEHAGGAAPGVWDAFSREWGIVSGASEWRARVAAGVAELARALDRERDRDPADEDSRPGATERLRRARALGRFIDRFEALLAAIPAEGRFGALARGLRDAWTALFDFLPEEEAPVLAALDGIATLDAMGGTPATAALGLSTLEEVSELLDDSLAAPRPPDDRFEGDGVFVAALARSRGLPFRTVILPGMVEGLFPRAASPDPLLSDSERRHLNAALGSDESPFGAPDEAVDALEDGGGDGPIPLRGASLDEERLLFRLAVDAASDGVVFTLPRLDSETGRERVPSWLLLQTVERATGAPHALTLEEFARAEPVQWLPLDPAPRTRALALTRLERDLVDLRDALASDDAVTRVARVARLVERSPFARAVVTSERNRWGEKRFTAYDGWIPPPLGDADWRAALDGMAFSGREVSATRLETWATCPYRYFLRYGLGLSALEEPERQMTMSALDRGSLIHHALECFWSEERDAHGVPIPDERLVAAADRLSAVANRLLDEFATTGITGPRVLWNAARAEIVEDLRARLFRRELDAGWVPTEFELGFGSALPGEGTAPEVPAVTLGALAFRGRIDRVDVSADGTRGRVLDYKTGAARVSFKPKRGEDTPRVFRGGEALQLPIYVLAAKQRFPEVKEWRAVYDYATRRGEFKLADLLVEDVVLESLEALVLGMATDAGSGHFPFIAGDHCVSCDYKDVCGPAHDVAFASKEDWDGFAGIRARKENFS